ncbi:MAG TPA: protein-L-isoaspartate(D-aspartate) O-methyltransferase [Verrucomicrobiae bacterium]|nr:protein-L-isoaspartate(D-aspartate) O-methyltransferase [Verrucomicrobiae bacterium]
MNGEGKFVQGDTAEFEAARHEMVARQIRDRGIGDERVLNAMRAVPRHLFVPPEYKSRAYSDEPLPIGEEQTISQPFMVAAMADALLLQGHERVLEIGGGSGYQAAVLSQLALEVIAIEARPALAAAAADRIDRLGYRNVSLKIGDGSAGWPSCAPYAAILVTAAAPSVPQPLVDELAEGGRLLIPIGQDEHQELLRLVKKEGRIDRQSLYACRFVPLVGRYGQRQDARETNRG